MRGLAAIAILGLSSPLDARADIVVNGSFGPNGDVGFVTSPSNLNITFGADSQGSIYQMDGFVNATNQDFGNGPGVSADLANGPPTGLTYSFGATQPSASQLLLTYNFTNTSGSALSGFQFLFFVDPDISTNYTNNSATVNGSNQLGLPNPTSYQVGDPSVSTLFTNLSNGTLSNSNDFPPPTVGDVALGLGFTVGTLGAGQSASFQVLLADDGSSLGSFSVNTTDPSYPNDILTVSGASVVPEPASWISLVVGTGCSLGYARKRLGRLQAWTRSQ